MNKKIIVALFGAAGAGKDSIQKEIVKQSPDLFHEIISSTTRPKREYEHDGIDYHFITDKQSEEYIQNNQYIEYAEFRGWRYGTLKDSIFPGVINIGVFNVAGVKQLLKLPYEEYIIIPIFIKCSDKERLLRQLNREEHPDCAEICRRFGTDKEDLKHSNLNFWYIWATNEYNEVTAVSRDLLDAIFENLLIEFIHGGYLRHDEDGVGFDHNTLSE